MRTWVTTGNIKKRECSVGMKPLSERDENSVHLFLLKYLFNLVGMKPLSERDENF